MASRLPPGSRLALRLAALRRRTPARERERQALALTWNLKRVENLREWRKRVKDLWDHLRLLHLL